MQARVSNPQLRVLTVESVVVAAQDQVASDLMDEVAILNLKNGVYYGLDQVGASVWHLIQSPHSIASIRDALLTEYNVDATRCEADLLRLLNEMATAGLVEVDGEPGS